MDILSYILGKKAGGGGGSTDDDWYLTGVLPNNEYRNNTITTLGTSVFRDWQYNDLKISMPELTTITAGGGASFFGGRLTLLYAPKLTSIYGNFVRRSRIRALYFPELTSVGVEQLEGLYVVEKDVVLPKVTTIAQIGSGLNGLGRDSGKTVNLYLPALTGSAPPSMHDMTYTNIVDLGNVKKITQNMFINCQRMQTLILRSGNVVVLDNVNAFTTTPFSGYNDLAGTVYVPSDLISEYEQATNWSTLVGDGYLSFAAIEGSQYENLDYDALAKPAKDLLEEWI